MKFDEKMLLVFEKAAKTFTHDEIYAILTNLYDSWGNLKEETNERMYEILYKRVQGETYKEIGEAFNISGERVRQIVAKAIYKLLKAIELRKEYPTGKFIEIRNRIIKDANRNQRLNIQ